MKRRIKWASVHTQTLQLDTCPTYAAVKAVLAEAMVPCRRTGSVASGEPLHIDVRAYQTDEAIEHLRESLNVVARKVGDVRLVLT